jgi:DNA (cytosine-5)-methyltransferase 1
MMDFSRLSRFGMTFKPLMADRGEELLTLYLAGFHAKTLVPQEKAQELMENDQECGEKWRGSFTKYDPDSSLWKTHQCSLLGDLDEFSETWPQWGLMRDGECWEQRTLEQTIRGTGFGLSPDGKATFHTPNTTGLDGGSNSRKALKKRMEKLPTPQASDYITKPTSASWKAKGGVNFSLSNPDIQAMWPTPDANCGMRGTQETWTPKRKSGHQAQYSINQAVRDAEKIKWPTPVKSDHAARRPSKGWQGNSDLPSVVWTETGGRENPNLSPAQLNATWVEWLMGWPLGWTDLKPLATDKSHFVPQPHGES